VRKNKLIVLLIVGVVSGLTLESAQAAKKRSGSKPASAPVVALTESEAHDLLFMREEEKLARDVYITLYAEWGVRVFNNISKSEQQHMDAILGLLNQYGQADPAIESGRFSDAKLQELFDALTAKGLQSKLNALMVGALIEEVDMEDLAQAMLRTDKSDIISAYINLMKGSENHLKAFAKNIEAITGEPYAAQWISQQDVDAILGR